MRLARISAAAAAMALLLAACGGGGDTSGAGGDPAGLEGTPWVLTGGLDASGIEQNTPSAEFSGGQVTGSTGCNQFNASYSLDGAELEIGMVSSTLKGCPPPAAEVEAEFVSALEAVSGWELEGEDLVLLAGDQELSFRAASPEGSWRATSFLQGDAIKSVLPGTEVTAEFGAEGDVSGSSGCNTYSGTYETAGGGLEIGTLVATEMACTSPPGVMEQEEAFLSALPLTADFTPGPEGGLTLLTAQGTIVATFEPAN